MPTFDPDELLSQALQEAWVSMPAGTLVWETLEFLFTVAGVTTAARFVNNRQAIDATLESDAPLDASTEVSFAPAAFSAVLPPLTESGGVPELQITTSNVGREMALHFQAAAFSPDPVQVIHRLYTSGDTSAPHTSPGPLRMDVYGISATAEAVTARCRWDDMAGRRFPRLEYVARRFPALAAR